MMSRLIIVGGPIGAGKTTLACQLADQTGGIRFCPDDWMRDLGVDLWDSAMRDRIEQLQWTLTQELLKAGMTVIIEWGTWARSERDALRARARILGAAVELHWPEIDLETRVQRVQARGMEQALGGKAITRDYLLELEATIQVPDAAERALYEPAS